MRVARGAVAGLLATIPIFAGGLQTAGAFGPPGQSPFAAAKDASLWSLDVEERPGTSDSASGGAKVGAAVVRLDGEGGSCNPAKASPMYRRVKGVIDVLEPREIREIGAMVRRKPVGMEPNDQAVSLYSLSMCSNGREARRIEVVMSPDGSIWSRRVALPSDTQDGNAGSALESLDRVAFIDAMAEAKWGWYAGTFDASPVGDGPPKSSGISELSKPYLAGRLVLDSETISQRLLGGRTSKMDRADRVLEIEKLSVRLPAGYSAREPAGLLVWIDAGDEGEPPPCLFEAMDASNVIAAGFARCGNARAVANRYQLALDAVATVSRRYHVDGRRVYVSGMSGGGRVASILAACFPDVYAGAIPIAGLSCSEPLPAGRGRYIPPPYAKPTGRLLDQLRQRRIGAITGQKDFNQPEITAAAQVLRGAGVQAKVFDFPDLGHALPSPERFAEAFEWVDEPYQKVRKAEVNAGSRALKAAVGSGGVEAFTPRNEADRAALMRVTEVAPWTPAAWTAVELLEKK